MQNMQINWVKKINEIYAIYLKHLAATLDDTLTVDDLVALH